MTVDRDISQIPSYKPCHSLLELVALSNGLIFVPTKKCRRRGRKKEGSKRGHRTAEARTDIRRRRKQPPARFFRRHSSLSVLLLTTATAQLTSTPRASHRIASHYTPLHSTPLHSTPHHTIIYDTPHPHPPTTMPN
ncbi:hypothetical protein BO71DRAFT_153461 [Aspergillus ellipticus CBS 707.79]|uniref:Uncharacterized protein n=1 Tax=Aspergillus ellipticus CBS 707.79 TaxID=1448320 RepID=A0A319CRU4_9EURO|nr:hypothetical protein BO71DRAFT_153461 [Aspergillus ellipticus CBS 707.79]